MTPEQQYFQVVSPLGRRILNAVSGGARSYGEVAAEIGEHYSKVYRLCQPMIQQGLLKRGARNSKRTLTKG